MTHPEDITAPKRYGIIAGWGNYPLLIARSLKDRGHRVYCLGVAGHASGEELRKICDVYREIGLGRFGTAVRFFRKNNVTEATMAGKIFKNFLLRPGLVWRHFPDFYTFSTFFPFFLARKSDLKDDTLLSVAAKAFERKGVRLIPATNLAPNLLIPSGTLTRRSLAGSDYDDIRLAWPLTREIGRLDFGQAVMVRENRILAIEGIDGTDETIERAGKLKNSSFTVLKIAKPNQDMRFDVPAVGLGTLEKMAKSGADILVVEANRTLCVDPLPDFIAKADQLGIAVSSLTEEQLTIETERDQFDLSCAISCLTKIRPTVQQKKDILFGLPVIRSLSRFGVGKTVTVRERSVLAVQGMAESRSDVILRTRELAPDGFAVILGSVVQEIRTFNSEPDLIRCVTKAGGRVIAVDDDIHDQDLENLLKSAESNHIALVKIEKPGP